MSIVIIGNSALRWGGGIKRQTGRIKLIHSFEEIISLENLCLAWQEFIVGKKSKLDVQIFSDDLMDNIVSLHEELANQTYRHGGYISFFVNDPKQRHIHKASVRDRLLHHAVHRILYPFFAKKFIADSFSGQDNKGVLSAINRFKSMVGKVSHNFTSGCWILKCDIKKFFASIDHEILLSILDEYILDKDIVDLLKNIVGSFETLDSRFRGNDKIGLPLGNLTSQLFANVYMNVFDQWIKHRLKAKNYIRYADDFVFLSRDKLWLESIIPKIRLFLLERLKLTLHPSKIFLKTFASGVDFLGWVHFPKYRILRATTKRRMFFRIKEMPRPRTLQSYLGLLKHGNTIKMRQEFLGRYWVWED